MTTTMESVSHDSELYA
jgi:hypothetical protein